MLCNPMSYNAHGKVFGLEALVGVLVCGQYASRGCNDEPFLNILSADATYCRRILSSALPFASSSMSLSR